MEASMRANGSAGRVWVLGFTSLLVLTACGGTPSTTDDGGTRDAGADGSVTPDGSTNTDDAGTSDVGAMDATPGTDGGVSETGAVDARSTDAGGTEGGATDAGPTVPANIDNLIENPGAEAGPAVRDTSTVASIPSWDRPSGGSASVVSYSAGDGFPEATTPGPATRGSNFFTGGDGGADTMLTQTRPLPPSLVDSVDMGLVDFEARGWFGGFEDHQDRMALRYEFLDASGARVGEGRIGNVTTAERMNTTSFLERTAMGALPARTRSVRFTLEATFGTGYVDAYADELRFALRVHRPENLIVNPGAEEGPGVTDTSTVASIPGWEREAGSTVSVVVYGGDDGFPAATSPGAPMRGRNFFTGGNRGENSVARQTRAIPAGLTSAVDAGNGVFTARGWFGGFEDHTDRMALRYEFLDAAGVAVGEGRIGNVTATERMNTTGMYERTAMGAIPARTRSVRFTLEATYGTGYVDAYADELAFYVNAR